MRSSFRCPSSLSFLSCPRLRLVLAFCSRVPSFGGEPLLLAAFAFAAYWVAYEYLTEIASHHSAFCNFAYSQMDCLTVIQIASFNGFWGIRFSYFFLSTALQLI